LLGGSFGAIENAGDLRKRHAKYVVEHEREPFIRRKRVEHDEQWPKRFCVPRTFVT
jgi:hypothetical protein